MLACLPPRALPAAQMEDRVSIHSSSPPTPALFSLHQAIQCKYAALHESHPPLTYLFLILPCCLQTRRAFSAASAWLQTLIGHFWDTLHRIMTLSMDSD